MLISSPLKRCVETAKIYFSDITLQLQPKLKESDFWVIWKTKIMKNYKHFRNIRHG